MVGFFETEYASSGGTFDAGQLGVAAGEIEAHFYVSAGGWVIYFRGLSLARTGPLCFASHAFGSARSGPYNHARVGSGRGACTGQLPTPPALKPDVLYECGHKVLVQTGIPGPSAAGQLSASVQKATSDGTVHGLKSTVTASDVVPKIDLRTLGCRRLA